MKYNTQNKKIASITEKTLIIGIDVGSQTHYARAFDWRNYEYSRKAFSFSNDESGFLAFKAWMDEIAERHHKEKVIPGMEPTGHYWFNLGAFRQEQGMRVVHVNPHHVKKSKELDDNNPNKNDRKDPKTIAALVNEGRFSYPYIPTGIYAEIRNLSNLRFQTQEEITRIKNRIARWFSIYFPEYKEVYGKPDAISGMMVLKQAPLPKDLMQTIEAAISVIGKNAEFKQIHHYYRSREKNPLKKMQSVVAVACKLIRIFYMILTKGIDYNGKKMLDDIRRPDALAA